MFIFQINYVLLKYLIIKKSLKKCITVFTQKQLSITATVFNIDIKK